MPFGLPSFIFILFGITILTILFLFRFAIRKAATHSDSIKPTLIHTGLLIWLFVQAVLASKGFYNNIQVTPQKLMAVLLIPFLCILALFITKGGRKFIDKLPLLPLTWLHTVRIAVEIVLYFLFLDGHIPQLMTFEGRNFDILAGLTAPLIAYFGIVKKRLSGKFILVWNIISLLLVLNIMINAILSVPTPFQQFAFDQPNIGVFYFPFIWLPSFIVPVVIFSHLVAIRQLFNAKGRY